MHQSIGPNNPFYTGIRNSPYNRVIDPETGEFAAPLGAEENSNIVEHLLKNDIGITSANVVGNVKAKYKMLFLEGLNIATIWRINYRQRNTEDFTDPNSVAGQNIQGGEGRLSQKPRLSPQFLQFLLLIIQVLVCMENFFLA